MCVDDQRRLFRQTSETNSETRFLLKFVNVNDEQKFPKPSVCIILVALVYLESAKIDTGPKIVRGLKRLRTTDLNSAVNLVELQDLRDGLSPRLYYQILSKMLAFLINTIVQLWLFRMRNAFAQVNAIAFANTARLPICGWAFKNWSVFVINVFHNVWWQHWKEVMKIGLQYGKPITSKLLSSFCKQVGIYWTAFAEISVVILRSGIWKFTGIVENK